jgi:hypothetical protein
MRRRVALLVGLSAAALLGFAVQAQAATFTVGSTLDTGGCASPPSGATCTLRQLINSVPAGSTIDVPAGTYNLSSGALTITQDVSIAGAGARTTTIAQGQANPDRVFDVQGRPGAPIATISGLTISGGTADSGNGFFGGDVRNAGTLTLSEVEISNGTTTNGSGAGISNDGGTLTITHSLVDNNGGPSSNDSGGIQNYGDSTVGDGHLTVIDSTIANNTSAQGGGIFSWCGTVCANTTTIINSTIAFNDGGARVSTGGGLRVSDGTISVQNSIVAFNTVDNPFPGAFANCGTSGTGVITSLGENLESQADCGFTGAGDLQNTDPQFSSSAPQNNGGNTNTLGVAFASPVVGHIPSNAAGCGGTDERDVARPQDSRCDVGAFEFIQPGEGTAPFSGALVVSGCSVSSNPPPNIDWGDGTSSMPTISQSGALSGSHTYAEEGPKTVIVSWTDDCGSHSQSLRVNVADAPLTSAASPINAIAGVSFAGPVATFTDANPSASVSDFSATVTWGDGTATPGVVSAPASGGFAVTGPHTYAASGSHAITVSITDVGGASTTALGTAIVTGPPSPVVTGRPDVKGSTTAAFAGSVNPDGVATTAHFEYGLDRRYVTPGASGPQYDNSTPPQPVGSDFSSHSVSASVTGLVPNALYHVRLVAANAAGTTDGPDMTFTTDRGAVPGAPGLGKTFNVSATGLVLIKVNGVFIPLTELTKIPNGTTINALKGTLTLTTAVPGGTQHATIAAKKKRKKTKTKTQKGKFGGAVFKVTQTHSGLATLALVEGAFKGAPTFASCKTKKGKAVAAALSRKTLQLLHGSAHGKFRTKGRYAAATVRGTIWTIADRCDGTLTHAIKDTVTVNDFVLHKTITLRPGHSYLALAKPPHKHK